MPWEADRMCLDPYHQTHVHAFRIGIDRSPSRPCDGAEAGRRLWGRVPGQVTSNWCECGLPTGTSRGGASYSVPLSLAVALWQRRWIVDTNVRMQVHLACTIHWTFFWPFPSVRFISSSSSWSSSPLS